jgi:flagellar FliJ protein
MKTALGLLIEKTRGARDEAASHLARLQHRLAQSQERLALIDQYRREYDQQQRRSAERGLHPTQWGNFSRFIGQLNQALEQQNREVEFLQGSVEQARRTYQDLDRKLRSFETLVARERARQQAHEARLEQKRNDEFANRQALMARRGSR